MFRRIHQVLSLNGASGLARFARKAAWERLPMHPTEMPFGPGHLQIEVSGKCNLKCPMCPRTFSDVGFVNMSFELYRSIVDSAPGLWSVNLQGYGEPFLNPELEEIIRWTRGRSIEVGFATNGTLLDERRARMVIAAGLNWLNVSMDGATPETFERIRVGARFDAVVENVRRMTRLNREAGGPMRTALAFVCMKSNLHELDALLDLAERVEMRRVFLAPVMSLTAEVPRERLSPADRARLKACRERGQARGIEVILGVSGDRFEPGQLPCDWPWNKMFITAEGRATPCCIENEETVGDISRDGGVLAVWNGEEYRNLRAGLTGAQPHRICRKHCFHEPRVAPAEEEPASEADLAGSRS